MTEPESGPALLNTCLSLEKELLLVVRKKGVLEKESHHLRRNLRICYTNLILHHYELSVQHDVEQSLWKTIFYKVIEALRNRLRRLKTLRNSSPSDSLEIELQKTSSTFSAFLASATKFYLGLVTKLEGAFGLLSGPSPDYILPEERESGGKGGKGGKKDKEWEIRQRGYMSCYRCYIFLGDLTRYIRDNGGNSTEWMTAAKYYNRALRLFPTNGNPHNQLAVLATYVNDDFNAMYHYFRSIAAAKPFPTSKENLAVMFEKNRQQAENLQEALAPLLNGRRRATENRVLRDSFLVFFIRIHGIIFSKVSVEKISQYKTLALKGFEDLLQQRRGGGESLPSSGSGGGSPTNDSPSSPQSGGGGGAGISEPLLLKVFAINIYAIWSCMNDCDIHPGDSYAEKMKKSVILRHAAKIAVEFFGRTVRACQASKQFGDLPFLGPLSTFTDWLGNNIGSVMPTSSQDKGPWHQMWKAFISFLNKLIDNDPSLLNEIQQELTVLTPTPPQTTTPTEREVAVRRGEEVLQEEIEMRGFLPFSEIHRGVLDFSGIPLFDFSPFECVGGGVGGEEEERRRAVRVKKLVKFGVRMSRCSEVQSIHFLEEKGVFSDRRGSVGGAVGKKEGGGVAGKKNRSRGRSVSTNGMDPNAAPINPYENEQFLYGSPVLSSPLGGGARGGGGRGSGEEEEEVLFRPEGVLSPHLSGSYDSRYFSFREDPSPSSPSPLTLLPTHKQHMSASTSSIPSSPCFSPSRSSPSSPAQPPSLGDFSYPFAPGNEGRGAAGGREPSPSPSPSSLPPSSSSRFEKEFSSWGIPLATLQHPQQQPQQPQAPSTSLYPSSPLNSKREGFGGWGSEGIEGGKVAGRSRGFAENKSGNNATNVNYLHQIASAPQAPIENDQGDDDDSNKERREEGAGIPSFFLTSLSSTSRYDYLEQNDNNRRQGRKEREEDDDLGEEISLPLITTNPIEEDEEEEEDLDLSGVGLDMIGKSPVHFPFGPSSWQNNVWTTPPSHSPSPKNPPPPSSLPPSIIPSSPSTSLPPSPSTPTLGGVQGRFRTNSGSGVVGGERGAGWGGGLYGGYSSFHVGISPVPSPSHFAQNWNFSPNLEKPAP